MKPFTVITVMVVGEIFYLQRKYYFSKTGTAYPSIPPLG